MYKREQEHFRTWCGRGEGLRLSLVAENVRVIIYPMDCVAMQLIYVRSLKFGVGT